MSSEGAEIDVPNASYVPERFELMIARSRDREIARSGAARSRTKMIRADEGKNHYRLVKIMKAKSAPTNMPAATM
jgi:hypothetical protein